MAVEIGRVDLEACRGKNDPRSRMRNVSEGLSRILRQQGGREMKRDGFIPIRSALAHGRLREGRDAREDVTTVRKEMAGIPNIVLAWVR